MGDGTHLRQNSLEVEHALSRGSPFSMTVRELSNGKCKKTQLDATSPARCCSLLPPPGCRRNTAPPSQNEGEQGQRAQPSGATFLYSAAKNCFAFTAACRWECAEGSPCGDCKRDQSRSLAASTNQNFQCAAMKRMRGAIHIRLSALPHLGAITQTRPQDSTSCIFSSDS